MTEASVGARAQNQRWGGPAIADAGTSFAVKDGWLGVDSDRGRWAVNSDAMIIYHGHVLVMSIMTQHDRTEQAGIDEVQTLAAVLASAVDPVR